MRSHVSSSSSEDRRSASEASTPSASSGMSSFSVPCEPSVSHVSEKVVSKIKRGELVDMAKLLRKDKPHDSEQLLSLSSDGLIQLAEKSVPITSFYKWMDAFLVFMSIRGRYFPHEFQGMLRHVELVKQVFSDNNDGSLYDYKFRAAKADVLCPNLCVVCLNTRLVSPLLKLIVLIMLLSLKLLSFQTLTIVTTLTTASALGLCVLLAINV